MATYQQTLTQALEAAGCYDPQGRLRSHCLKIRLLLWRLEPHQPGAHIEAAHIEAAHIEAAHIEAAHIEAAHIEAAHIEAAHIEAAFREADCLETIRGKVWVRARCLRLSGMVRRCV